MPRESSLRLPNSPLVLVLAQVKITPVLEMEGYISRIQERLRHAGYPRFQISQLNEFVLAPTPAFSTSQKWVFSDRLATTAVAIGRDFVVLETSAYTTFEAFTDRLRTVLTVFAEVVEPALCERLGLRYVNLIRPAQGETLGRYLHPGLLGLSAETLGLSKVQTVLLMHGKSRSGDLAFRLTQSERSSPLPPDLEPSDVSVKGYNLKGPGATLDLDHFAQRSREYSLPAIIEVFWDLHDQIENAFKEAVSKHALARWGADKG